MRRFSILISVVFAFWGSSSANAADEQFMVKVLCYPNNYCKDLMSDLSNIIIEEAGKVVMDRLQKRLNMTNEELLMRNNDLKEEVSHQLCDDGRCLSTIAEALNIDYVVQVQVFQQATKVQAKLFSTEKGAYVGRIGSIRFKDPMNLLKKISELLEPIVQTLDRLLEQDQIANCKGAEQIVDLKGIKGLEVKLNKRTYTLSSGRHSLCMLPGSYKLVAGGKGYFPQELSFTVGTIPVPLALNPVALGRLVVSGNPTGAQVRWRQPKIPNSNELIEQEVFSLGTAAIPLNNAVPGRHRFTVSAAEHAESTKEVTLTPGGEIKVDLSLTARGQLTISGEPSGARVRLKVIEGHPVNCTGEKLHPEVSMSVKCRDLEGRYALTVLKSGFAQHGPETIDVGLDEKVARQLVLEPCPPHLPPEACSSVLKSRKRQQWMVYGGAAVLLASSLATFGVAAGTLSDHQALFNSRDNLPLQVELSERFNRQILLGTGLALLSGSTGYLGYWLGTDASLQRAQPISRSTTKEQIRQRASDKMRLLDAQ